jgi:Fe2+ or Zn2+ uptake regulation protein
MLDLTHALEALSRAGLRRTPQRIAVIEVLAGNRDHPTAEAIWSAVRQQMPSVSLSTVYSTLNELESLGLIQQVADDPMRVDPDVSVHAHLLCRVCGSLVDVPDDGAVAVASGSAERAGHAVESVTVGVTGVCASCRRKGGMRIAHA